MLSTGWSDKGRGCCVPSVCVTTGAREATNRWSWLDPTTGWTAVMITSKNNRHCASLPQSDICMNLIFTKLIHSWCSCIASWYHRNGFILLIRIIFNVLRDSYFSVLLPYRNFICVNEKYYHGRLSIFYQFFFFTIPFLDVIIWYVFYFQYSLILFKWYMFQTLLCVHLQFAGAGGGTSFSQR